MQLAEMGFPLEACRKAVYYTGNMGPEMAFNWIIAHMEEPGKGPSLHSMEHNIKHTHLYFLHQGLYPKACQHIVNEHKGVHHLNQVIVLLWAAFIVKSYLTHFMH